MSDFEYYLPQIKAGLEETARVSVAISRAIANQEDLEIDAVTLLNRVPFVEPRNLKSFVNKHSSVLVKAFGCRAVEYLKSGYVASGRGEFGRDAADVEDRGKKLPCRLKIIF